MERTLFSVCICTYNRAELLARALESICQQSLSSNLYEIIVIDNGSTDSTKKIVKEYLDKDGCVRYCFEAQIGLSYARNRGRMEGKGAYIVYMDDDCIVPEDWLSAAEEIVDLYAPDIFGGPYYATYNTKKPEWFKDVYGSGGHGDQARFLNDDEYLSGGNFFVRKELLEQVGGFRTDLGMTGEAVAYGEETQLIKWVRDNLSERTVFYTPELFVYHLVNPRKWDLIWVIKQRFLDGRYQYRALSAGEQRFGIQHIAGLCVVPWIFLFESLFAVFFRNRKKYPKVQNFFYECTFNWVRIWGKLVERLRCNIVD